MPVLHPEHQEGIGPRKDKAPQPVGGQGAVEEKTVWTPAEGRQKPPGVDAVGQLAELRRCESGAQTRVTLPLYCWMGRTLTRWRRRALMPFTAAWAPVIVVMRQMLCA